MSLNRLFASVVVVGLLGLGLGACNSGTSTEEFCVAKCECETCTDAQQTKCTEDVEAERTSFENNGCDYDAYLDCAGVTLVCADTGLSFATTCKEKLLDSCDVLPGQ
ncbi:MAG TPA: hypothetical protein ENK23_04955 [Sorangium sp.]|nr:hypothetical protein [Sorangium sp.]